MVRLYISGSGDDIIYNIGDDIFNNDNFISDKYDEITEIIIKYAGVLPDHLFFPNVNNIKLINLNNIDFVIRHNFIKKLSISLYGQIIKKNDFDFLIELNLDCISFSNISYESIKNINLPKYIKKQYYYTNNRIPRNHNISNIYYGTYCADFPPIPYFVFNQIMEYSKEKIDLHILQTY